MTSVNSKPLGSLTLPIHDSTDVRGAGEPISADVIPVANSQVFRTGHSDATVDRLTKYENERSNRRPRALQEPIRHINESYSDYQKRRMAAGYPVDPQESRRSPWDIVLELIFTFAAGGPIGGGPSVRPIPVRPSPRPSTIPSPRPSLAASRSSSISFENTPLIPPKSGAPTKISARPSPVRPQIELNEGGGLSGGESGAVIQDSGVAPEPTGGAHLPAEREPESLSRETWNRQSKDDLNDDLVQKINETFEYSLDVRVHTSKTGEKTYLIYDLDDKAYISIESNETWYPTETYNYHEIYTWRTGNPDQKYAPIDKFAQSRESLDGKRYGSVIEAIKKGVRIEPVQVKIVSLEGETKFEIVNGNHRLAAARVLRLKTVPYEIVR
ncbi:ParB N-terminal domain-containing protein [Burkholderia mayonis]|uniref:ParB N-terminal domain-containing protein n=1 Tax=Burkholderia mayonis TaxID=1385591 RepID=UPI000AEBAB22|nr:ParB N-terminal domain-containing protein [Burkholderia mayonis]